MSDEDHYRRPRNMMRMLAMAFAAGEHPTGSTRDIVDDDTALHAVMYLFAVLDARLNGAPVDETQAIHGMAMLMLIRERIRALPDPVGQEAFLEKDLKDWKRMIKEGGADFYSV